MGTPQSSPGQIYKVRLLLNFPLILSSDFGTYPTLALKLSEKKVEKKGKGIKRSEMR